MKQFKAGLRQKMSMLLKDKWIVRFELLLNNQIIPRFFFISKFQSAFLDYF